MGVLLLDRLAFLLGLLRYTSSKAFGCCMLVSL